MSQLFHVHPDNPQPRLLKQAVEILQSGGVIVYPTDSGYALGCSIGNKQALDRIVRIRQIEQDHHFSLMCRDLSELATYARVDNQAFRQLKNNTPGLYTFIFKGTKEVPRRLLNPKRKTIGIRVPDNVIALALLEELNEPIMSTTLIFPGENEASPDPDDFKLMLQGQVDLIIHGGYLIDCPTTVVDYSEGFPEIVRLGNGDPTPFED